MSTERRKLRDRKWLMRQWADATRHQRWDEANQFWQQLMRQWLTTPAIDQAYWNDLLDRRMAVLDRKDQRTVSDIEFDNTHGDINQ